MKQDHIVEGVPPTKKLELKIKTTRRTRNTKVKCVRFGNNKLILAKGKGTIVIMSYPRFKVIFEDKIFAIKEPTDQEMFEVKMNSKSFSFDEGGACCFFNYNKHDTIKLLLTIVAQKGWQVFYTNVMSSFLNGFLHKEIYVEQPKGFVIKDKEDKVYLLKKTIYTI
ncbi:hypothetical protein CR513_22705, partial [Mucuna pruriens]